MAIDHKEPDRVPVDFWWTHEMRDNLLDHLKLKRSEDGRNWL